MPSATEPLTPGVKTSSSALSVARSTSYRTPLTWKVRPRLPPKTDSSPGTPKKASCCWAACSGTCSIWTARPKIGTGRRMWG